MWWFVLFLSETLGHKLIHWGASVMNLLLLTVPPLHSPVLEPDLHLKQQENGEEFWFNLCSQIFFLARLDCSSRQGNVCVSVHHFSPTTVGLKSNFVQTFMVPKRSRLRRNPTDFTSTATGRSNLSCKIYDSMTFPLALPWRSHLWFY